MSDIETRDTEPAHDTNPQMPATAAILLKGSVLAEAMRHEELPVFRVGIPVAAGAILAVRNGYTREEYIKFAGDCFDAMSGEVGKGFDQLISNTVKAAEKELANDSIKEIV